jgi:hypothetical protein
MAVGRSGKVPDTLTRRRSGVETVTADRRKAPTLSGWDAVPHRADQMRRNLLHRLSHPACRLSLVALLFVGAGSARDLCLLLVAFFRIKSVSA